MRICTKDEIIRYVEEEDVEFIRLQFTDMFGTMKNMAVTRNQLEKADIFRKIAEKRGQLEKLQKAQPRKLRSIHTEADEEIESFNRSFDITPLLLVNIVLKF